MIQDEREAKASLFSGHVRGGKRLNRDALSLRGLYEWVQVLVCAVTATVLLFTFAARVVLVSGPSMRETLQHQDCLLVMNAHLCGGFEAGDIVIIRKESFKDGEPIVKRVIATEAQALVCSVLAVVLLFTFVIRLIGVDGHSMVPTLQDGDRLLVLNAMLDNDYEYGDIVVLRKDTFLEEPIVKRVIATEGQTVDIDFTAGAVYVDGQLLEEDYIRQPTYLEEGLEFPVTVPEGCVFVMGDNRNDSDDSRDPELGPVDTRQILGRAVFLLFPGVTADTDKRDFGRIGPLT